MDGQKQTAPDVASILVPALKFGALTASAGLVVGGVAGVVRNTPAVFFATASGIQCFALGTTYWGSRNFILQAWDAGNGVSPTERLSASSIAGAVAGSGTALLTRGPRNVIPGAIMFGLFGFAGQHFYNAFAADTPRRQQPEEEPADADANKRAAAAAAAANNNNNNNFWQRLALRKWTPFTMLTDEQYEHMLSEKLLRLDADLALVDDRIADLKLKEKDWLAAEAAKTAAAAAAATPPHK